jgi:hypothetical protein
VEGCAFGFALAGPAKNTVASPHEESRNSSADSGPRRKARA